MRGEPMDVAPATGNLVRRFAVPTSLSCFPRLARTLRSSPSSARRHAIIISAGFRSPWAISSNVRGPSVACPARRLHVPSKCALHGVYVG